MTSNLPGKIDRRMDERISHDITVEVSWTLNAEWKTVSLVNFSRSGFCLKGKDLVPNSRRCHVRIKHGGQVLLIVASEQWRRVGDGDSLIGCSFLNVRDFGRFQDFLNRQLVLAE